MESGWNFVISIIYGYLLSIFHFPNYNTETSRFMKSITIFQTNLQNFSLNKIIILVLQQK